MPRQEKVKRSEVVPITEVQQNEISIAKQRLATAKLHAAASSQTLAASKESQKLAKKMLFNADKNLMLSQTQYDLSQKELHDAEKMLLNAEKRYAAVVDVEDTTSLQLDNLANAAAEEDKSIQLEGNVDNNNLANAKNDSNKKRKADTVSSSNNQQVDAMQTLSADSKQESNKKRKAPSLHTADQKQDGGSNKKKRKAVPTGSGEWTNTEHKQFKEGIIKYGWGCWKEMADTIITTRDRQQVKSHAQKLKKNHPDVVVNLIQKHECVSHRTIKKEKKKKKKTPQRSNRQGSTSSSAKGKSPAISSAKARVPVVHHHQITPPTTIVSASKLLSNAITKVENDINGQGNDKSVAAAAAAACDELGPLF